MKNEPVAFVDNIWIKRPDLCKNIGIENLFMRSAIGVTNYIPLYTQPTEELTDAEIVKISEYCDLNPVLGVIDFAREIIRKAKGDV